MKPTTLAGLLAASLAFSLPHALCAAEQDLEGLRQKLASPDYENRRSAVTELLYVGEKRPLKKEEIDLLLPHLQSDADWRIKVRITLVLPYAADRGWVLQPLIMALQDRDDKLGGGGNVPSGACRALARLGDSRGLQPIKDWLRFLESHPKAYGDLHDDLIRGAKESIAELKSKLEKAGSNKSVEPTLIR
jgi:hypothetical protein